MATSPDATETTLLVLESGLAPRRVGTFSHAPGFVPVGLHDPERNITWLLVAHRGGTRHLTAALVRMVEGMGACEVLDNLTVPQRPALGDDGSVVVFSGNTRSEGVSTWSIHHVTSAGMVRHVGTHTASWVLPAGTLPGGETCILAPGESGTHLLCGTNGPTLRHSLPSPAVRDVVLRNGVLSGQEVGGSRPRAFRVDTAVLSLESTLILDRTPVLQAFGTTDGRRSVPLATDRTGTLVVVREDSTDRDGRQDSRLPPRFVLVNLITRERVPIHPGGSVVEIYGVEKPGGTP